MRDLKNLIFDSKICFFLPVTKQLSTAVVNPFLGCQMLCNFPFFKKLSLCALFVFLCFKQSSLKGDNNKSASEIFSFDALMSYYKFCLHKSKQISKELE